MEKVHRTGNFLRKIIQCLSSRSNRALLGINNILLQLKRLYHFYKEKKPLEIIS